jgi:uncharacterized protein
MTQLMKAVKANRLDEVNRLLASGVSVDERDGSGDVPLIMAAYLGHTAITKALLEAGADVRATDPGMKATALHAAAYAGRAQDARLLIEHGVDLDAQGPMNGYTALHDAIWQNNIETAQVILAAHPNLALTSHEGLTALAMATKRGRSQIAALISTTTKP